MKKNKRCYAIEEIMREKKMIKKIILKLKEISSCSDFHESEISDKSKEISLDILSIVNKINELNESIEAQL